MDAATKNRQRLEADAERVLAAAAQMLANGDSADDVPPVPTEFARSLNALLSLGLELLAALAVGRRRDPFLTTPTQLEQILGVPVLGAIFVAAKVSSAV